MEETDLRSKLQGSLDGLLEVHAEVQKKLAELEEKEKKLQEIEQTMAECAAAAKTKVGLRLYLLTVQITLNIGGKKFTTTKTTLLSVPDTYFHAMLSSGKWLPDEDGEYFIDRNPKVSVPTAPPKLPGLFFVPGFSQNRKADQPVAVDCRRIRVVGRRPRLLSTSFTLPVRFYHRNFNSLSCLQLPIKCASTTGWQHCYRNCPQCSWVDYLFFFHSSNDE
jgi:hypothetical protein